MNVQLDSNLSQTIHLRGTSQDSVVSSNGQFDGILKQFKVETEQLTKHLSHLEQKYQNITNEVAWIKNNPKQHKAQRILGFIGVGLTALITTAVVAGIVFASVMAIKGLIPVVMLMSDTSVGINFFGPIVPLFAFFGVILIPALSASGIFSIGYAFMDAREALMSPFIKTPKHFYLGKDIDSEHEKIPSLKANIDVLVEKIKSEMDRLAELKRRLPINDDVQPLIDLYQQKINELTKAIDSHVKSQKKQQQVEELYSQLSNRVKTIDKFPLKIANWLLGKNPSHYLDLDLVSLA